MPRASGRKTPKTSRNTRTPRTSGAGRRGPGPSRGRGSAASSRGALYAVAVVLVLAALAGTSWLLGVFPPRPEQAAGAAAPVETVPQSPGQIAAPERPETQPGQTVAPERTVAAPGVRSPGGIPERPVRPRGRIVIVVDDAGYNLEDLEPFLKFPGPLSIAVLPGLPHSAEAARRVKAAGKELLLHQPMEALGGEDPGPGAIRADMDELTIAAVIADNLSTVPGAVGMNNHMGSAVTRNPEAIRAVLETARAAGLYYLDSLTVSDSMVHSVASHLNLKTWERDVFLDNYPERAVMLKQFDDGVKHAEKKGLSVMIGHVWSAQLAQTLVDLYPGLIEQGFSLSTISRIMLEDSDEDPGD